MNGYVTVDVKSKARIMQYNIVSFFLYVLHLHLLDLDLGFDLVAGEYAEGVAHHRGAHDFAERADVRQA